MMSNFSHLSSKYMWKKSHNLLFQPLKCEISCISLLFFSKVIIMIIYLYLYILLSNVVMVLWCNMGFLISRITAMVWLELNVNLHWMFHLTWKPTCMLVCTETAGIQIYVSQVTSVSLIRWFHWMHTTVLSDDGLTRGTLVVVASDMLSSVTLVSLTLSTEGCLRESFLVLYRRQHKQCMQSF